MNALPLLAGLAASFAVSAAAQPAPSVSTGPVLLTLSGSAARALEAATSVRKAAVADGVAAEQLLQGYAQFLPNLEVAGGYSRQRGRTYLTASAPATVETRNHGDGYQVASTLNLFSGLADYSGFRAAVERRRAASLTLERARQQIVLDTAQAYLQVLLDDRVTGIAEENARASSERQRLLEQQSELGARSLTDLYRQQAQTSADEAFLIQARNKRRDDLILLLRRLRLDLGKDYALAEVSLDSAAAGGYDDEGSLVAAALSARPDLGAAAGSAEAARRDATGAAAGFWPRLDLGWTMQSLDRYLDHQTVNGVDVVPPSQRSWNSQLGDQVAYTVGITASWGIFDRLTTRLGRKRAEAAAENARLDYEDARLQAEGEVKQAFGDLHAAEGTLAAARQGLKAARASFDAVRLRYEVSASSLLDLLTAQTALLQAEAALAQAEIGFYLQNRQMEFALGRRPLISTGS
jgi:outer membrane protein